MSVQEFHKALLSAQRNMRDPVKDATNPHFKSRFVSLRGICEAVRPALQAAEITVTQAIDFDGDRMFVRTVLTHVGGGSIEGRCPVLTAKANDPQAMGSAITYARRYSLAAICGVAPSGDDDDDGSAGAKRDGRKPTMRLEPFDSVEFAIAAIEQSANLASLEAVGKRIKATTHITGIDRENAVSAYRAREAELKRSKNNG